MSFDFWDIVKVAGIALVLALVVNHYAGLNIPFLTNIENSIVSSGENNEYTDYSSSTGSDYSRDEAPEKSRECISKMKMLGDAQGNLRKRINDAEDQGDMDAKSKFEERLEAKRESVEEACR